MDYCSQEIKQLQNRIYGLVSGVPVLQIQDKMTQRERNRVFRKGGTIAEPVDRDLYRTGVPPYWIS